LVEGGYSRDDSATLATAVKNRFWGPLASRLTLQVFPFVAELPIASDDSKFFMNLSTHNITEGGFITFGILALQPPDNLTLSSL
jgi:hypothetical protein